MELWSDIIQNGTLEPFQRIAGLRERLMSDFDDETSILRLLIGLDRHLHFAHSVSIAPEIMNLRTSKNNTVIHLCVSNMSHRILQYFGENPALVVNTKNEQNHWGETALHLAASIGNPSILEKVITLQVDQSLRDKWNRTAADVAVEMGNGSLLNSSFSSSFISPTIRDTPEEVINHSAQLQPQITGELKKALLNREKKLTNKDQEIIVKTIFSQCVDKIITPERIVSGQNSGAITCGSNAAVMKKSLSRYMEYPGDPVALKKLLFDKDIDINGRDSYGLSALHKVVSWDQLDLVELLLSNSELDINAATTNKKEFIGYTALHFAIESRCLRILDLLITDPRIKLDIVESKGRTYSIFAADCGDIEITNRFSNIS